MPLLPTEANLHRALAPHLRPGESVELLLGAGRRVLALTSARVLVSTFPLLRAPELLVDLSRQSVTSLDWQDGPNLTLALRVETIDGPHLIALPHAFSALEATLTTLRERLAQPDPSARDADDTRDDDDVSDADEADDADDANDANDAAARDEGEAHDAVGATLEGVGGEDDAPDRTPDNTPDEADEAEDAPDAAREEE